MSPLPAFDPLGLPAPLWLLFGLKVFGFWVHLFFMNLWLAGLLVGLVLIRRREPLATAGRRLVGATPIWIALGVNAGIVPLLFVQVLYPQFFYTSTILQAGPWLAIIPLLIVAYYGTYVYVLGRKAGRTDRWIGAAGWTAAAIFLAIGVMFATQMQFMTAVDRWAETMVGAAGGTSAGTRLALGGAALHRFVLMIGLALGTTAAYLALDVEILRRRRDRAPDAGRTLGPLILGLATLGLFTFALGSMVYWPAVADQLRLTPAWTALAAAGPLAAVGGAALFLVRPGRATAFLLLGLQLSSLLFNAIARQMVQVAELAPHFDLRTVPVNFQVSPVLLFAVTLVLGLTTIGWLVHVFVREGGEPEVPTPGPVQRPDAVAQPPVAAGGA
jgi:hypothetical protein